MQQVGARVRRRSVVVVAVAAFLAAALGAPASSGDPLPARPAQQDPGGGGTSLKAEYDEIIGQEAELLARVEAARDEQARLAGELRDLEAQLVATQAEAAEAADALVAAEAKAKQATEERKAAEREVAAAKDRLREQIVASYVSGGADLDVFEAVLDAESPEEASGAVAYSKAVVGDSDRLVRDLQEAREARRKAASAAKRARAKAEEHREEVDAAAAALAAARDQQAVVVRDVEAQVVLESEALREVLGRKAAIEGQIASMNRTSDGVAATLASFQAGQPDWKPGDVLITNPIPGYRIGSKFGQRKHPILGTVRLHAGGDMGAPSGTTIYAPADGIVVIAGERGGYGNTVVLDHGFSLATLYGHQSRIDVEAGQLVKRGDPIGAVGSTGLSTGPHLHFETRLKGVPTDPESIVDFDRPETTYEDELRELAEALAAAEAEAGGG